MPNTSYSIINSLEEISFIGGTNYILEFKVYDSAGGEYNLSGATCTWKMALFGSPEVSILSYSGTITGTNIFEIEILSANTKFLSGKFIHQPIIVDSGKEYRSQQGIINITAAIV